MCFCCCGGGGCSKGGSLGASAARSWAVGCTSARSAATSGPATRWENSRQHRTVLSLQHSNKRPLPIALLYTWQCTLTVHALWVDSVLYNLSHVTTRSFTYVWCVTTVGFAQVCRELVLVLKQAVHPVSYQNQRTLIIEFGFEHIPPVVCYCTGVP